MESVSDISTARSPATARAVLALLRPKQWVKNVVVFAGPAAALKFSEPAACVDAFTAFAAFCLTASAAYAINDVLDREADARHPTKRDRPVASGAIRPVTALGMALVLIGAAVTLVALRLNPAVLIVLGLYFSLTLSYSLALKERVLLDVIIIATGFVLRAWVGSLAVGVATSEWLVACVFTLCLFMGFCKRRCELTLLGSAEEAGNHRTTLLRYTPDLLNHLITLSAGVAVITFLLYTLEAGAPAPPFHKEHLFFTLPLVVYGIFRFAMLAEVGRYGGPTEILLKDRGMLAVVFIWTVIALLIAYEAKLLGPGGFESLFGVA